MWKWLRMKLTRKLKKRATNSPIGKKVEARARRLRSTGGRLP